MKNLVFAALILCAAPAFAQVNDRVIDLPETSGKWYLTVIVSSKAHPSTADSQLIRALNHPSLLHLRAQTHYRVWDNSDRYIQQTDWKLYLGAARPAILLQKPADENGKGHVVFYTSGNNIPSSGSALAAAIQATLHQHMERCPRCPSPPRPVQPVTPPVAPPTIPHIVPPPVVEPEPEPVEREKHVPLVFFLLPAVGAGLGVIQGLKQGG